MIEKLDMAEVAAVQSAIDGFIAERLETKLKDLHKKYDTELKKLSENDIGGRNALELERQEKVAEQEAKFERKTWVSNAAIRAGQLSLATHALKFTHPDAKGTNIFARPSENTPSDVVATPAVPREDVVGNAAALDVYKFLSLEAAGKSLLLRAFEDDPVFLAALGAGDEALAWFESFRQMTASSSPSSHTLAKQIYWPLGDGGYHLLSPLFPSSLVQQVYESPLARLATKLCPANMDSVTIPTCSLSITEVQSRRT
ncbi:type I-F CRISPR-associated protein Csy1 [Mailhella sp.]